jgi:hypothetical protein
MTRVDGELRVTHPARHFVSSLHILRISPSCESAAFYGPKSFDKRVMYRFSLAFHTSTTLTYESASSSAAKKYRMGTLEALCKSSGSTWLANKSSDVRQSSSMTGSGQATPPSSHQAYRTAAPAWSTRMHCALHCTFPDERSVRYRDSVLQHHRPDVL